jgi:hypothetical protein
MTRAKIVTSREQPVGQATKSQTSANFVQTCNSVPGSCTWVQSARFPGLGGGRVPRSRPIRDPTQFAFPESREPPSTAQQRGSPRLPTRRAGGCVGRSAVLCRARSGTWRCATGARLDLSPAGFASPAAHEHARTAPPPRWRNRRPMKHAILWPHCHLRRVTG